MANNILQQIISDEKIYLAHQCAKMPLTDFVAKIVPSKRSFYQALSNKSSAYILECKKASPSKGLIRTDFQPQQIAQSYQPYATAISVLTNEKYFQGKFENLSIVSNSVSQPVLCKGFIIDIYQINLARFYQADAVLLMLAVLTDEEYGQLASAAHNLNMGVLTEVSTADELQRALQLKAKVIGINNRNLRDLTIDLNRTRDFAQRITAIAPETIIISESGINSFATIQALRPYVNGFLIGSSLMQQANLNWAVKKLIYGANKVCGLTRVEDAQCAAQAGAVYGGLIFATDSPRNISLNQAQRLIKQVPELQFVAVFRQPDLIQVVNIANQLAVNAIQLHGKFDQQQINQLRSNLPTNCQIWLAISIAEQLPQLNWQHVDRYIFDNALGGSGKTFDWQLLNGQTLDLSKIIIAGGLNSANCATALGLGCDGLDFNSGVESSPGIKNHQLIKDVFQQIKNL